MVSVDSLWFWIAIVFFAWGFVTLFSERQQAWLALGTIVLSLVTVEWWGQLGLLERVGRHPLLAVGLVAVYLVLGAVWSLARWWLFVAAQRSQLAEVLLDWLQARGRPETVTVPDDLVDAWRDHLTHHGGWYLATAPSFADHRRRILLWIVYWPFSLVWTALHDDVVEASRWLMLRLRWLYVWIAAWVYRDVPSWRADGPHARDPNAPSSSSALDERLALPSVAASSSRSG